MSRTTFEQPSGSGPGFRSPKQDVSSRWLARVRDLRSGVDRHEAPALFQGTPQDGILERFEQRPQHVLEAGLRRQDPRDTIRGEKKFDLEFARLRNSGLSQGGVNYS